MKREDRYLVFKMKDVEKYLTTEGINQLMYLELDVTTERKADGKKPLQCVVVEKDWPMYEDTWEQIENWVHEQVGSGDLPDNDSNRNTAPRDPRNMRHG